MVPVAWEKCLSSWKEDGVPWGWSRTRRLRRRRRRKVMRVAARAKAATPPTAPPWDVQYFGCVEGVGRGLTCYGAYVGMGAGVCRGGSSSSG